MTLDIVNVKVNPILVNQQFKRAICHFDPPAFDSLVLVTQVRLGRNLQRTHWYTLTGPTDAWPGHRGPDRDHGGRQEYVDYHLAPDPVPAPHVTRESRDRGHVSRVTGTRVTSDITGNVTAHLWQSVYLRCTVTGFVQGNINIIFWNFE